MLSGTFTATLVGGNGSVGWFCAPRFDGGACFAALPSGPENGYWRIAPAAEIRAVPRRYRDDTPIVTMMARSFPSWRRMSRRIGRTSCGWPA
ncbi:hypothetical protein GCM10011504_35790 [Siccirubricoccus deserti]|nr:hypothetical protein GCM10011504_35790 [Siccirubricoccus deserti]